MCVSNKWQLKLHTMGTGRAKHTEKEREKERERDRQSR